MYDCMYLLLSISIQNKLFCCENIAIDNTLQDFQHEKQILPKCLKESVGTSLENLVTHFVNRAGRVNSHSVI